MKITKNGFTLIELLGVIVLLAIIIGLVFPNVISIIKKSNSEIDLNTKTLIFNAADLTLKENLEAFPNDEVTPYCLTIRDLISYGYLMDNVKIENEEIQDMKAVKAVPDSEINKNNYDYYSNGYGYDIVDKSECANIELNPKYKKCLNDKKCHICNKLSDLKEWGYLTDNVILNNIDITSTHSYDFGDSSLGIKAGYVTNEECENSKINVTYIKLPNFSNFKAISYGLNIASSDYYSIDVNGNFSEQVRKNSSLRRNLSKDNFSTLLVKKSLNNDLVEYSLNNKIVNIASSKLVEDTNIIGAYKVCLNGTSNCQIVEKNTVNYEFSLGNISHNALLVNGNYVYDHSGNTYIISNVDKDYIIYTRTIYTVTLNGTEYGKYESGSNVTVNLSNEEEFNNVSINGSSVNYDITNLTCQITNILENKNIITKMIYTITFNDFLTMQNTSSVLVEKGTDYSILLDSSIPKAERPFNKVTLVDESNNSTLVSGTDYTYSKSTGLLTIPNVNKNILVKAYYKVTYVDNTFMGAMGFGSSSNILVNLVSNNKSFTKDLGTYIPDILEVKIGNNVLSPSDYTYNGGNLSINKKYITNNVTITASDDDIWVEPPELYDGALTPIVYMQIKYSDSSKTNEVSRTPVLNTVPAEESGYYYRYEWVVADPSKKYYNYKKQIWANAVVLKPGITKNVGDFVEVDPKRNSSSFSYNTVDVTLMFVWIPRFSYTIGCGTYAHSTLCHGNYSYGSQINGPTQINSATPGVIDVNFISKSNKDTASTPNYTDSTPTNFKTLPAFTLIESDSSRTEIAGVWIAKFAMGHKDKQSNVDGWGTGYDCSNTSCSEAQGLFTLPKSRMLMNTKISAFYYLIKSNNSFNFSSSLADIHMWKNSEAAAAIYLSLSLYGKVGNINYDADHKYVAGNVYGSFSTCYYCVGYSSNDKRGKASGLYTYDKYFEGTAASTTGNIYGIYDMGTGITEFLMANYQSNTASSGFSSISSIPSKYINKYTSGNSYGHALKELDLWFQSGEGYIYSGTGSPWMTRGDYNNYYPSFHIYSSGIKDSTGTRPAIFVKTGS